MKRLIYSPNLPAASEVKPERERRHGLGGWVAMGSPRFDRFKCTRSSQDSSDQFPSCALFQLLVLELGSQSQHFNSDLSLSAQQQQPRKRIDLWFTNRLVEIRAPEACLSPRRARNWFQNLRFQYPGQVRLRCAGSGTEASWKLFLQSFGSFSCWKPPVSFILHSWSCNLVSLFSRLNQ